MGSQILLISPLSTLVRRAICFAVCIQQKREAYHRPWRWSRALRCPKDFPACWTCLSFFFFWASLCHSAFYQQQFSIQQPPQLPLAAYSMQARAKCIHIYTCACSSGIRKGADLPAAGKVIFLTLRAVGSIALLREDYGQPKRKASADYLSWLRGMLVCFLLVGTELSRRLLLLVTRGQSISRCSRKSIICVPTVRAGFERAKSA